MMNKKKDILERGTLVIGKQVLRSGTSVGAHVREGKRSRSDAELVSKIEGGLPELEETVYWLELLVDSGIVKAELMKEADELISILVSSAKTIKIRKNRNGKWDVM
jgi:four helix bundle protein